MTLAVRDARGRYAKGKAETGAGVAMIQYSAPMFEHRRSPQRIARAAQETYHSNPWVRTAETAVTRRVVGMDWHLEDSSGDTIEDGPIADLFRAPQARLAESGRLPMTWRSILSLTSRHMGLCNIGFWYLDERAIFEGNTPLSLIYVNPARVWPALNGDYITGWVLDAKDEDGRGGTPLELAELIPFWLDPPDRGAFGVGLVETAALKARITNAADKHGLYVLETGGRLAGIVSPREGTIPDEAFKALVREFRNVAEAPDAAKRTTILQGPVDFEPTSANPTELNLIDLGKTNRDDILAVWGVPPSQAGIPSAAGLNSGEVRNYDEAVLYQGAVHDRIEAIRETIQTQLIDRYGLGVKLVFDEPEFDDRTPLFDLAAKAREQPLTNEERRGLMGFDPLDDDELNKQILLPATLTQYTGEPKPTPPPSPFASPPKPPMMMPEEVPLAKAGLKDVTDRIEPAARSALRAVLAEQLRDVADRIRARASHISAKPKDASPWWDAKRETARLERALRPHLAALAEIVATETRAALGRGKADPDDADFVESIERYVIERAGSRVTQINEATRDFIASVIAEGIDEGVSPAEIADRMEAGIPGGKWDPEYRAELIARTETAYAYNEAKVSSFEAFDITSVEVIDGTEDDECAEANGQIWTLEEALADPLAHPNCVRDFIPYYGAKAQPVPRTRVDIGAIARASDIVLSEPIRLRYDEAGRVIEIA